MANLIEHLTSIFLELRSGPCPGRRVVALTLCAVLALSSTLPAVAFAGRSTAKGPEPHRRLKRRVLQTSIPVAKKRRWKMRPHPVEPKKAGR